MIPDTQSTRSEIHKAYGALLTLSRSLDIDDDDEAQIVRVCQKIKAKAEYMIWLIILRGEGYEIREPGDDQ